MVDEPAPVSVLCSRCDRSRADTPPEEALAWAMNRDERGRTWLCPACARAHARAIEGKLPDAYW